MGNNRIKRVVAKEALIILGLSCVLYILSHFFLQNVPIVLPRYRLEFANGQAHTINIMPEIRNDSNYQKLLKEAYDPSVKLIDKRIKEFVRQENIKSALKKSDYVNSRQVYLSKLYSRILSVTFILKLAIIYLVLLLARFIFWALRVLKKGIDKKYLISLILFFLALPLTAYAETISDNPSEKEMGLEYTKEIGVFTGYAKGKLDEKGSYRIIPGIVRLGFNLNSIGFGFTDLIKPITDKLKVRPKGFTELILEPFINTVIKPDDNLEAGCAILLKYAYPATKKLYPYVLGGGGVLYMSQHTREQSTQYNFVPQIGAGVTYFIRKGLALNAEYRYRHLSNAGLEHPNKGINVNMILIGLSLFY